MRLRQTALLALTLTLGAVPVLAGPVAEVTNHGDALVFHPVVEFDQIVLTVTGPCNFVYTDVIKDGDAVFRLSNETIDGDYSAELRVVPRIDGAVLDVLAKARATGDESPVNALCREGALPGEPSSQLDGFHVDRGQIVYDEGAVEKLGGLGEGGRAGAVGSDRDGGALEARNAELPGLKDQVIPDDLIVQASLCVGFDCVNNESFGFDTIRLKENNLRIKFQDTSSISGYPSNDWQLTANSSASGGQNMFAIEDVTGAKVPFTVEAAAPTNSVYVDSTGRVGFRTATPVLDLHVATSNTPGIRLEQNNSGGFTAQTWDIAGNEANFFVRDVTGGSRLPLRIRPGAPSSAVDISSDGEVGVGTASPSTSLHVRRTDGTAKLLVEEASATQANRVLFEINNKGRADFRFVNTVQAQQWQFFHSDAGNFIIDQDSGGTEMRLEPNGNLTIEGSLFTSGPSCGGGCDLVFSPEYEVESIADHAASMWANRHLPAVGPTPEGQQINLTEKTGGILNELEKAHIYIEQLSNRLEAKDEQISALNERLARLEQALDRVD